MVVSMAADHSETLINSYTASSIGLQKVVLEVFMNFTSNISELSICCDILLAVLFLNPFYLSIFEKHVRSI